MDDAVKLPRRRPIETLHPTAQLVQDEVVGIADQTLKHELKKRQPEEFVRLWPVARGGMRRLCAKIAADMIKIGLKDADSEGREPTERQHQIALTLASLTRRQRRQTVAMALVGHRSVRSGVHPIKAVKYPEFERGPVRIVETRRYIRVGIRRALGRTAAAIIVRTNPNHEIVQSSTAEYTSLEAWAEAHPAATLAAPPEPVDDPEDYYAAMRVMDSLRVQPPSPEVASGSDADVDGSTDDLPE